MLRIEGTIESSDTYMAKLYFNDSSGRLIYTDQFHIVPETGTELAEATTGNETLLKVKDASNMEKGAINRGRERRRVTESASLYGAERHHCNHSKGRILGSKPETTVGRKISGRHRSPADVFQ